MICDVTGCSNNTREGKLYCLDHVDHQPYVQGILAKIASRERELEAVREKGWRAVDVEGIVVDDILRRLREHGARTVERLRRECLDGEKEAVAFAYKDAMARAGLVLVGFTKRGSTVLAASS